MTWEVRAQRQRVSGAEDAGSVGVCLPGANNVMSRTQLRQDARALSLSRSLERSLPLSLSLSRSLSPRSLARSLGVCVSRSQSHKTRAKCARVGHLAWACADMCVIIKFWDDPEYKIFHQLVLRNVSTTVHVSLRQTHNHQRHQQDHQDTPLTL